MSETIKAVVKNHTDTAANLAADNIIPLSGEITFESDTLRFKIGDGINAYNSLPYSAENSINGYVVENITDATDVTETLPDATTYKGEYTIKRRGAGTGEVLIATVDSQTIDGLAPTNYKLIGESILIVFPSGGNWEIKEYENRKQQCKAWVNFDGTGTPTINDSFNVSSITDNGTGDFTLNFTNALKDANYSVLPGQTAATAANEGGSCKVAGTLAGGATLKTTTQLRIQCYSSTTVLADYKEISVHIFGS